MANGTVSGLGIGKRRKQMMDRAIESASTGTSNQRPRTLRRSPVSSSQPQVRDVEAMNRSTRQKMQAQEQRRRQAKKKRGLRRRSFGMRMSSGPVLKGGNI